MKIFKLKNLKYEIDIKGYNLKHSDKYAWIIHLILMKNIVSNDVFYGFVNLQSQILKNYLGDRFYKKILENLSDSGIIEVNDSYEVGSHSKSYRLTEKYKAAGFESVEFVGKKADKYLKKYNKYISENLKQSGNSELMLHLLNNVKKISIDFVEAKKNVERLYNTGVVTSPFAKCCQEYYIDSIAYANVFFTESAKTGRVYHTIANCNRTIRPYLYYQGEMLVQVDIANSQPVIFCALLRDYVEMKGYTLKYNNKANNYHLYYLQYNIPYVVPFLLPKDVQLYFELTQQGKFYEFLMEQFGIPATGRDKFKKDFFEHIFYSKVKSQLRCSYAKKFKALFPVVHEAILWYKKDSHQNLPIELQKQESQIIIHQVCERIMLEYPEKVIISVHDSIACLERDQEYVYEVMKEELTKGLGFTPKVCKKSF